MGRKAENISRLACDLPVSTHGRAANASFSLDANETDVLHFAAVVTILHRKLPLKSRKFNAPRK